MLKIKNLSKTYKGGVKALDNINLEIPAGMFGLLGPNGAGKSTLMRTIATLQQADKGSITFGPIDVLADKMALRKQLGYLPQEFGAYPRTSPEVMLNHFAALKGIHGQNCKDEVESLLVRTNLWDVRKRNIDKFSGGMKQRFGIAQSLIGQPKLIIVDEPTAGLDPAERRRFQNLLANIGEEVVVILSTHIVEDVSEICPRMAIIGDGRILLEGEPAKLVQEMEGRLWRQLADKGEITVLRETEEVLSTRFAAGQMEVRVLAEVAPQGMTAAVPELEDVYFATLLKHNIDMTVD